MAGGTGPVGPVMAGPTFWQNYKIFTATCFSNVAVMGSLDVRLLKCVFCVDFTEFYCLAFEQNYGKAQLDRHRLSATKL